MFVIGLVSVLSGMVAALSAYLQVDARWYKGALAVLGLIVLSGLVFSPAVNGWNPDLNKGGPPPVVFLGVAALWGAISVGFGVSAALITQSFAAPGKIVGWVFVMGTVLVPIGMRALL